jgi:hypothetical protein
MQTGSPSVLALLLPRAFPSLHWVHHALSATDVILHDTLRFSRKYHLHRGMIPTPDGPQFLYIPLLPTAEGARISEIKHEKPAAWIHPVHKMLIMNYRNSIYFDFYEEEILDDLKQGVHFEYFTDFASFLAARWLHYFDIKVPWSQLSKTNPELTHTDAIGTLKSAVTILTDPENRQAQPKTAHPAADSFEHPSYRHHFGFLPGCTVLDLLFSCGPESWKILDAMNRKTSPL